MLMNWDLIFLIACAVFVFLVLAWLIWNIWLEDYLLFREFEKKKFDLTPDQQEKINELTQRIDEEIRKLTDQGDDD